MRPYSILPTDCLLRPKHLTAGALTPEAYLEAQRADILRKMAALPLLNWRMPFVHQERVALKVCDSQWQLVCECGGVALYDPEWALGACFSCGAIYRQEPPSNWRALERVLTCRPSLSTRHILPGQTLADLVAENIQHGDRVSTIDEEGAVATRHI